jgi:hypothetical protein
MDENTTLEKVSKKSKFLWLYILVIVIILVLIVLFVFVKTNKDSNPSDNIMADLNDLNIIEDSNFLEDENIVSPEDTNVIEIIEIENPENCGTNLNCFKQYAAECKEGARFLFTDVISTENKSFTRTTEYTINGIEYIYCKVNLSLYDINVEITGEDDFNESMVSKEDIGTDGTCYFETPQSLIDYLDKKDTNTFSGSVDCFYLDDNSTVCSSTGDMVNNSCEGDYFMLEYE